jgi:DNA-binding CsgD family transcriptional regulator
LSFTALGDLFASVEPASFVSLADPQRRALDAALLRSRSEEDVASPRTIGTGIVSLLARLSASTPLLLAIDDLQWMDLPSARALRFALRRLAPHPIAVLATWRHGELANARLLLAGADEAIRTLRLGPLSLGALYRIVERELGHRLSRPLLVRIERATGGNPFYAIEVARMLDTEENQALGEALPIPHDLREVVAKRLRKLPQRTREALLRVSALAQPTTALIDPADLAPAEEAGVARVRADGRIELAHPLFAGAVYAAASHVERRRLHGELSEIAGDVEERAKHLMLAREGRDADEHVADVLDHAAEHALRRGAVEVAAELDEQAARHTPMRLLDVRSQRSLRAARHHLKAGDPGRTKALCAELLEAMPPSPLRAYALGLLAEACASVHRLEAAIPPLEEALACVGEDASLAARLEISLGIVRLSALDVHRAHHHLSRAVELAERTGDTALVGAAVAVRANGNLLSGRGVDERELESALALEDPERDVPFQMRVSMNVAQTYEFTGRVDLARGLLVGLRERLVARGEESDLPWVLAHLASTAWLAGDLEVAEREADHAEQVAILVGVEVFRAFALMVRAMIRAIRGNREGARADGNEAVAVSERIGWPIGVGQARCALGLLSLSEGHPEAAVTMLQPVVTATEAIGVYEWPIAMCLPDAIEALVATGDFEQATRLTDALGSSGRRFDRPWALATSGRCRALLAAAAGDLDGASTAAREALLAHERLPMPFELGRTLLLQGQVQRRRGERRAGRATLGRALGIFKSVGAPLWAERAAGEIARIGVRRAPSELTEGEERVAKLAADGLTNPEIAARLFMSRRTVEANLARAYGKLGIHSRAELGAVMAVRQSVRSP